MRKKAELEGVKVGKHTVLKCLSVSIAEDPTKNGYIVLLDNRDKKFLLDKNVENASVGKEQA